MKAQFLILFFCVSIFSPLISFSQRDLESITKPEEIRQYLLSNAPSEDAFVELKRLAKKYIDKKDWAGAIEIFQKYRQSFGPLQDRIDKIIELLKAPSQNLEISNIDPINTPAGEYFPVITIDGKRIYFTGSDRKDGVGGEDIFYSDLMDGKWQKPKLLGPPFSTKEDDAIN